MAVLDLLEFASSVGVVRLVAGLSIILGAYAIYTIIVRIYFHPLSHIPGPKLAAATFLYQTWYCFVGGSRFYLRIAKLHKIYGPVIRITPDEVHLSDADNYDTINRVGTKFCKDAAFYGAFGNPNSSFTTPSNELHRIRRSGLNSFFARKVVLDLEDVVQSKVALLSGLVRKTLETGGSIDLHHGLRAVSIDVVTDYAFGTSYDLLKLPDLGLEFFTMVHKIGPAAWIFRQWPWIRGIAFALPEALLKLLSEPLGEVAKFKQHCSHELSKVKENMDIEKPDPSARATIFSALLNSAEQKPGKAYIDNVLDEAYTVLSAAADTTGNAMTTIVRHVVSDPRIYQKLHEELKAAFPDENEELDFRSLEKLPFLTMVIKEGLRLSFGVPGRLPRVVPDSGATFNSYALPAGAVVSMSSWVLHHDEDYFPDPKTFNPDRWEDPVEVVKLEKAFVPFGKGSRGCVGITLAYCELYVTIGTLFRKFPNMQGNHLAEKDLVYDDFFSSYNPLSATKFHVTVTEKELD